MLPGIAIFGNGTLAHLLINYFREYGFKVEAFWCANEDDGHKIRNLLNIPFFSNQIDQVILMPRVQLIVIASTPHYHSQIASKACSIGKHVICNWPPSYSINEMITMCTAATNYPSLITMFYTALRFIPAFQTMKKLLLDSQLIGNVKLITATVQCDSDSLHKEKSIIWDRNLGGGLLSMFGSNLIDVISYITGLKARRVTGLVRSFNQVADNPVLTINADDFVSFQMELIGENWRQCSVVSQKESIIANITLNGFQYSQYPSHELYVYGSNGYLVCRDSSLYACLKSVPSNFKANPGLDIQFDLFEENLVHKDESFTSLSIRSHVFPLLYQRGINQMVVALKNAFYGGCNGRTDQQEQQQQQPNDIHWAKEPVNHAANFDDGLYIQSVIEAVRLSSEQKRSIIIPQPIEL